MFKFRHQRYGDNDKYWGPFTYSPGLPHFKTTSIMLNTGDDDEYPGCYLQFKIRGRSLIVALPPIIKPYKEKVTASGWDDATKARLGRDWYYNTDARRFGFYIFEGYLCIMYGRSSDTSTKDKSWGYSLPWTQWRYIGVRYYDLTGQLWATINDADKLPWKERIKIKDAAPTKSFQFLDFDGEAISVKTYIEEMEHHFGTKPFKWLSWFVAPKMRRSLMLEFQKETGRRKGSWKGGTVGHSIRMLPGELHESAFRRYCQERDMTFVRAEEVVE